MPPLTYVAVDPAAIEHNLGQVRGLLQPPTALMAVVKADGYGHGLLTAARAGARADADWLGVSQVAEGVALREAGLEPPLLVFLPFLPEEAEALVTHRLSGTVVGGAQLLALAAAADCGEGEAHFHLFLDGGLGRPGAGESLPALLESAAGFPGLVLDGLYTHLDPSAAAPRGVLELLRPGAEWRLWGSLLRRMAQTHWQEAFHVHAAASSLTLRDPAAHLDLVRVGTLLYGQYPAAVPAAQRTLDLRPALELRSTVIAITELPPGAAVGYGAEFRCRRATRVGLLPVGYAQGLGVMPSSLARRRGGLRGLARRVLRGEDQRQALLGGRPAALLGRTAMDWCCVDLTDHPQAGVGVEVVLPCRRLLLDSSLPRVEVAFA